jgi:hypothetical protein
MMYLPLSSTVVSALCGAPWPTDSILPVSLLTVIQVSGWKPSSHPLKSCACVNAVVDMLLNSFAQLKISDQKY